MMNYSGYYNRSDDDLPLDDADLFVKSCGHYKLIHLKKMHTVRPTGRGDYQLLYVAEGMAHFQEGDTVYDVGKGGVFLYQPEVPQNYYYVLAEKPDIYWLHFTGRGVEALLNSLGLPAGMPMLLQAKEELTELFEKIIAELRMERYQKMEMTEAYFRQLLIMMARNYYYGGQEKRVYHSMFDEVINQFHHEYQKDINIARLADSYHISCCWFIREFKQYTGYSPKQYITNLRLQNAKELLRNHSLSISEISSLVGYENQLYFSRIFHRYTGMSPSEYRERERT
ncbi:MAG: yesS 2 [Herbinix sp.]|jgi:AraC-like DNA-binding protein|nr:yesS 2 [Herbinix sp.]